MRQVPKVVRFVLIMSVFTLTAVADGGRAISLTPSAERKVLRMNMLSAPRSV
jgi:hypothetical protein